jgi:hypothetical protein
MATTIRAVKTGTIRIRPSHRATDMSKPRWRRRLAIILDRDWTQPLPIYTYLIEHDEGLLLLDSGECARSTKPGWFPWWNPFFNCAVDIHVEPDDEIGPRLRSQGIDPTKDLKSLVLSHLHHDHADGLDHFEGTDIVVSDENFKAARPRITVTSLMQIAAATCNVGDAEEFSQSGMRPAVRRCLTEQSLEPNTLLTTACRGHHECSASTQPHSSSRIGAYPWLSRGRGHRQCATVRPGPLDRAMDGGESGNHHRTAMGCRPTRPAVATDRRPRL